jgi:hypothetical protein
LPTLLEANTTDTLKLIAELLGLLLWSCYKAVIVDCRMEKRDSNMFSCVHTYKADSTNSKRTRLANEYLLDQVQKIGNDEAPTDDKTKAQRRRISKKLRKKKDKISNLESAKDMSTRFTKELMEEFSVLFFTWIDDPVLTKLMYSEKETRSFLISKVQNKLNIQDSIVGSKFIETGSYIPLYVLVPRKDALCCAPTPEDDVKALRSILKVHSNINSRGSKRSGVSSSYAIIGATVPQQSGLRCKLVTNKEDSMKAVRMMQRMEHFAKMWLPFGLLTILKDIKNMCNDNTTFDGEESCKQHGDVWASMACSYNYISPAHTDEDAFLGCMTVSYWKEEIKGKKEKKEKETHYYKENDAVALYLCFPRVGFCVALRPGDVCFFNPLEYHCISQRTDAYKNEDVFVSSFYLKSHVVGGHDNSQVFEVSNGIYLDNLQTE